MILIDGKKTAAELREELKQEVSKLKTKYNKVPGLTVILIGDMAPSQIYVRMKEKAANEVGLKSEVIKYPESVEEKIVLDKIDELNKDDKISGILVQLPLPKHIDKRKVIETIDHKKDVDGFHPVNAGLLFQGEQKFIACTPHGIIKMLEFYNIDIQGKNAVVLGRSNIVGKPASMLLLQKHATVTICHSRTKNLQEILKEADIIVAAIGRAHFVTKDMVKKGAVVIDVGINRLDTGKLAGDVDFENVKDLCSHITPVPGGVGPMTITMLLWNTVMSLEDSIG